MPAKEQRTIPASMEWAKQWAAERNLLASQERERELEMEATAPPDPMATMNPSDWSKIENSPEWKSMDIAVEDPESNFSEKDKLRLQSSLMNHFWKNVIREDERYGEMSEDEKDNLYKDFMRLPDEIDRDDLRDFRKQIFISAEAKKLRKYPPILRDIWQGVRSSAEDIFSLMHRVDEAVGLPTYAGGRSGESEADRINRETMKREQLYAEAQQGDAVPDWIQRNLRTAARSVTTAAVMAPLGPYGIIAGFGAIRGNQAITEAEDAGLTGKEKWAYVGRAAAIEGGIAGAFQLVGAGGFESLMGGASKLTKPGIKAILKRTGITLLQELPEENLTEIVDQYNQILSGTDPENMTWDKAWQILKDTTISTTMSVGFTGGLQGIRAQPGLKQRETVIKGVALQYQIPEESVRAAFDKAAEAQEKGKNFDATFGRELHKIALQTEAGVAAWALLNAGKASELIDSGKASRKAFEKAGLPRMENPEQRQEFVSRLISVTDKAGLPQTEGPTQSLAEFEQEMEGAETRREKAADEPKEKELARRAEEVKAHLKEAEGPPETERVEPERVEETGREMVEQEEPEPMETRKEKPEAEPEPAPPAEDAEPDTPPAEDAVRTLVMSDDDAGTKNRQMKAMAEERGLTEKDLQEHVEAEVVAIAREIAAEDISTDEKWSKLLGLYQRQPRFTKRTTTSVVNQAYSTPIPLAFAASEMAGINPDTTIYEPTAGTGALLIEGDPANVHANELNDLRRQILEAQGHKNVTSEDARKYVPEGKYDAVIMNPPFGKSTGEAPPVSGWNIRKLDHRIAVQALKAMDDNGTAAIIVGAGLEAGQVGQSDRVFMNYLMNHFNVADNFEVSGDLYRHQGASFPVRVMVIHGRKAEAGKEDLAPETVDRLSTWDEVFERMKEVSDAAQKWRKDMGPDTGARVPDVTPGRQEAAEKPGRVPKPAPADVGEAGERDRGRQPKPTEQEPGERRPVTEKVPSEERPERPGREAKPTEPTDRERPGRELSDEALDEGREVPGEREERGPEGQQPRVESPGPGAIPGSATTLKRERATETQDKYAPISKGQSLGTLSPKSISLGTQKALMNLEQKVGDIDAWVTSKLGYESVEQMTEGLAAEQVDGVALAIDQIESGRALIIGDETGIGKGRQAAAIMRYGKRNGMIPVFFTQDPKLFSDMYRDISDIGEDMNPFLIGNTSRSHIKDANGMVLVSAESSQQQKAMMESTNIGEHDAIFIAYSQIQNAENAQQAFLERMAQSQKLLLVMDESHEAAGRDSTRSLFLRGGETEVGKGSSRRKVGFHGLQNYDGVRGVVYLSATYAKRPDNAPLYLRTELGNTLDYAENLEKVFQRGGVALQQVVAEGLAQEGQMVRREKDFTGVNFDTEEAQTAQKEEIVAQIDGVTSVFRSIVDFSNHVTGLVKKIAKMQATAQTGSRIETGQFSSIVHNYVSQLLLAAKADAAADRAIALYKDGKKPVLTLMNTMGSFLDEFVTESGAKYGESVDVDFGSLLKRALDRTLRVSETDAGGDTEVSQLSPGELGLTEEYQEIADAIDGLKVASLPISPIDWMRKRLTDAGIKVGELTGRGARLDYTAEGTTVYQARTKNERDKNANVNGFNDGTFDALILNAAGSTGLSLHASEKVQDQRPRHIIMVQPHLDINVVMQTFGRILRTGMAGKPSDLASYSLLVAPLEAERRPASVLATKMKSLNANTTAETGGAQQFAAADIFNKYGDAVVAQVLLENPDLQKAIGIEVEADIEGAAETAIGLAKRVTGRMAILSNERQAAFYNDVLTAYNALVSELKQRNEYDLEVTMQEGWDAKLLSSEVLEKGTDNTNMFRADVVMAQYEVKDTRTPPKMKDIRRKWKTNFGETDIDKIQDALRERAGAIWKETDPADYVGEMPTDPELRLAWDKRKNDTSQQQMVVRDTLKRAARVAGKLVDIETEAGARYQGVLTNIHYKVPKAGNPTRPSLLFLEFSVASPVGRIAAPANQVHNQAIPFDLSGGDIATFDDIKVPARANRHVLTGNILRGMEAAMKGQITSFETQDGEIVTGIVMPMGWTPKDMASDPRLNLNDASAVIRYLQGHRRLITTSDNFLTIERLHYGGFKFSTSRAKRTGGKYFTDTELTAMLGQEFSSLSNKMVAQTDEMGARLGIDHIIKQHRQMFQGVDQKTVEKANSGADFMPAPAPGAEIEVEGFTNQTSALPSTEAMSTVYQGDVESAHEEDISLNVGEMVRLIKEAGGEIPQIVRGMSRGALGRFRTTTKEIFLKHDIFIGPVIVTGKARTQDVEAVTELLEMQTLEQFPELTQDDIAVRVETDKKGRNTKTITLYRVDSEFAGKVLAHEIGHLTDYMPDETLVRGNILGHLATLKKYIKQTIDAEMGDEGTPMDSRTRRSLRKQARAMAGYEPKKGTTAHQEWAAKVDIHFSQLADKMGFITRDQVMRELKDLTLWWNPFNPEADPRYTKYRFQAKELYAEAMSVLLNAPGELRARAPMFHAAFFQMFDQKPDVKDAYNAVLRDIESGVSGDNLLENIYGGFERGDEAHRQQQEKVDSARTGIIDSLGTAFQDRFWVLNRAIGRAKKQGKRFADPRHVIDAARYTGSQIQEYHERIHRDIALPLEEAGLTEQDFGAYLLLLRAMNERSQMANPVVGDVRGAEKAMSAFEADMGAGKMAVLEDSRVAYRNIRSELVLKRLRATGIFDDDFMRMLEENEYYATFEVVDYIDRQGGQGTGARIFKQFGTVKEVGNPLAATMATDKSLMWATNWNEAKMVTADFLKETGNYQEADTEWNGKTQVPVEPRDPTLGLVTYQQDGKVHGFYTEKAIANAFQTSLDDSSNAVARILRLFSQPFRLWFTTIRPGFQAYNIFFRDPLRTFYNLKGTGMTPITIYKNLFKSLVAAGRETVGIPDPVLSEMRMGNLLMTWANISGQDPQSTQFERMQAKYAENGTWDDNIGNPFRRWFSKLLTMMNVGEIANKRAAYVFLKDNQAKLGLTDEEIAYQTRHSAGSPSFITGGTQTPITNNIFLFSNAQIQGITSDIAAWKADPYGVTMKRIAYNLMPKAVMIAFGSGLMARLFRALGGDDDDPAVQWAEWIGRIYAGASEYDLANYNIIPLGIDANGKPVYLRIPQDETGRTIGGLFTKLMTGASAWESLTESAKYMGDQGPGVNPALSLAWESFQYMTGTNPYDSFRQRSAIPEREWRAGGMQAHKAFSKWLWNRYGGSFIYRFRTDNPTEIRTELQKTLQLPFVGDTLGRFIRVSDYGFVQKANRAKEQALRGAAKISVEVEAATKKKLAGEKLTADETALLATEPRKAKRYETAFTAKGGATVERAMWQARTNVEKKAVLMSFMQSQGRTAAVKAAIGEFASNQLYSLSSPRPSRRKNESIQRFRSRKRAWQKKIDDSLEFLAGLGIDTKEARVLLAKEAKDRGLNARGKSFQARLRALRARLKK